MADGAVIASTGTAPQAALFDLPALSPSQRDANAENLVNARFELHRALDRGVDADLVAWARRWGETLVDDAIDLVDASDALEDLDDDDTWVGALEADKVRDVEACIDSAREAVAEAQESLGAGEMVSILTANDSLNEALKHLSEAARLLD